MKNKILVIALLAGIVTRAGAMDQKAADILQHMDAAEKKITTLVFDYSEEINYCLTKERQRMNGTVSCAMPNKLAVKQTSPLLQDIISDGKKVWVYTPTYHQVLVDNFKKWEKSSFVPSSLITIGRTAQEIRKKYTVTVSSETAGVVILDLVPLKKDAWRMTLWIDHQTYLPQRAVFDGDNVTISLSVSGYLINTTLDPGMFSFTAPSGVEEIKVQ
ncbi:MAG: outer-membrane lipoprotein carrier protein LolA [Endomicrobiales bacterium]|jgi:chaperone LolA